MTWAGQSVFALPCGAGLQSYGVRLGATATIDSETYGNIGDLVLNISLARTRAVTIQLTGDVSNNLGDSERTDLTVSIDGTPQEAVCTVFSVAGEDPSTVAVTVHVVLAPGTYEIRGVWRLQSALSESVTTAQADHLQLEALVSEPGVSA